MLKTYAQAMREALDMCLAKDKRVFVIGLGVPDPKGIFGATLGLQEKYGPERVMDMPIAENAVTGAMIGAAINGMRPVLTHQRVDFSLMGVEQVINNAAKWSYMFNGQQSVPLVIKMTVGMGWGQGPQHSQSLQALYAHIPGLKVVMPWSPRDAKGLMIAAIEDNNPVVYIDHRWLHDVKGDVPDTYFKTPIGKAAIVKKGKDVSIIATSLMTSEALRASRVLERVGVSAEVVDVRSISPLDISTIKSSVQKTKRFVVADLGYHTFGIAAEIVARVAEDPTIALHTQPIRITAPDMPTPSTPALAQYYYPRYVDIIEHVAGMVGVDAPKIAEVITEEEKKRTTPLDVPDKSFTGPF